MLFILFGNGFFKGVFMDKQTFYLSGVGIKITAICMTGVCMSLTVTFIIYRTAVHWGAIAFIVFITGVFCFGDLIIFSNRITIVPEKNLLKIYSCKIRKLDIQKIGSIVVDTKFSLNKSKYCFIVFELTDSTRIQIPGFSSLSNKNSVERSKQIIEKVNHILQKARITM